MQTTFDEPSRRAMGEARRALAAGVFPRLATALGYFGIAGLLLGFVAVMHGPKHPHFAADYEFPLSKPVDVVADAQGRIYVAVSFYRRVQVYDDAGRFLYGFFTSANGGDFRLQIDEAGRLNVVTGQGKKILVYADRGKLIESRIDKGELFAELNKRRNNFVDNRGRRYEVHNPIWNPEVVRIEKDGGTSLSFQTPAYLTPLIGPGPCFFGVMLWVAVYGLTGAVCGLMGVWNRRVRGVLWLDTGVRQPLKSGDIKIAQTLSDGGYVALTSMGVVWSEGLTGRPHGLPFPETRFHLKRCGPFRLRTVLEFEWLIDPAVRFRFYPQFPQGWMRGLQSLGADVVCPTGRLGNWLLGVHFMPWVMIPIYGLALAAVFFRWGPAIKILFGLIFYGPVVMILGLLAGAAWSLLAAGWCILQAVARLWRLPEAESFQPG